jgi:hypothetical protein
VHAVVAATAVFIKVIPVKANTAETTLCACTGDDMLMPVIFTAALVKIVDIVVACIKRSRLTALRTCRYLYQC